MFPESCFSSKDYAGLKVHQLECAEKSENGEVLIIICISLFIIINYKFQITVRYPEAFLLSQWLERGVFEALEKQYLKSLSFSIFVKHPQSGEETLLESYQFLIDYPDGGVPNLNGMSVTKENLKRQAVRFIRGLVEFTNTLEDLPSERWLSMKLLVSKYINVEIHSNL